MRGVRKKVRKFSNETEEKHAIELIKWIKGGLDPTTKQFRGGMGVKKWPELALLYHIPNGGSRSAIEGHRFKLQGVLPGIPDYHLPVARKGFHGLYIELKRIGGVVAPNQLALHNELKKQGYAVEVCYGAQSALNVLINYLQ